MYSRLLSAHGGLIALGLLTLIVFLLIPQADAATPLTAEDLMRLRSISSIALSSDGSLIAYTVGRIRNPFTETNGKRYYELFLTDQSGNIRPFITGNVNIGSLQFSPDDQLVTYLAKRNDDDTTTVLYGIPVTGGESIRLLTFTTSISSYAFSSDNQMVVFLAKPAKDEARAKLKKKGFDAEVYEENWQDTKIWIADLSNNSIAPRQLEHEGTASSITISPDGTKLACALQPTPSIDDQYMARQVVIFDLTSGAIIQRYPNHGKLGAIVWSPDSKRVAVIAGRDINDPKEGELYLGSIDNDQFAPVMIDLDGHLTHIDWLDNKRLLYLMNTHLYAEVGTVNADGTNRKQLIAPGRPLINAMYLSRDKKSLCFRGESFDFSSELFVTSVKKMTPLRLTNSNPWLADRALGKQEPISWSARDGVKLEGILIHPVDEQPNRRYPMVMIVHGGPESNRRDEFLNWATHPAHVLAGRGYFVFVPNYRGSTGRGVEFSKMGQGGYAEAEFNDLVDGIAYLDSLGLIDKTKVGITGGSYGGYASAWGATALSEHFAASVMGYGVSDLISKFGTTDIPNEMYDVHARSWPHERWEWYLTQSPIYHARESKTPTLILAGKDDTRVHPSQSLELYRYLKTFGQAPVRLVLYPGEGHGNSKAAGQYDYCLRLIRWMDHYLKGPGGEPPAYELDYSVWENELKADEN